MNKTFVNCNCIELVGNRVETILMNLMGKYSGESDDVITYYLTDFTIIYWKTRKSVSFELKK